MGSAVLVVVILSLGVALIMSLVAWRVVRDERRRSAARVAALVAASEEETPGAGAVWVAPLAAEPPAAEAEFGLERVGSGLFDTVAPSGGGLRHVGAMAIVAVVLTAITALTLLAGREGAAESAPAALELVSLSHARDGDQLRISGAVRYLAGGLPSGEVFAETRFFDRTGELLGTARAPLRSRGLEAEITSELASDADAVFAVASAGGAEVGRYRVSFLTAEDGIVAHIDRRARQSVVNVPRRTETGDAR